ncbi:hypothetical protein RchiOBHm_Chr5g0070841 [Rosa chinensis]|uniref:Uncharacterized protein n=1 Tax=Rosa chinensis TaxID=74649 RepID=A0A2P6QK95_ROSCH|nr:hypothetical protein RchiOBHm_Chr5g0070841 [Rosa chinensis]
MAQPLQDSIFGYFVGVVFKVSHNSFLAICDYPYFLPHFSTLYYLNFVILMSMLMGCE